MLVTMDVKEVFIHGLELALIGERHPDAEPMKGASVLEICERHKGDAYRAIYRPVSNVIFGK